MLLPFLPKGTWSLLRDWRIWFRACLLATGLLVLLIGNVMINLGVVMGLMPVVGVPLPLISYGGSSTVTIMVAIGLLINVSMRRFMFE